MAIGSVSYEPVTTRQIRLQFVSDELKRFNMSYANIKASFTPSEVRNLGEAIIDNRQIFTKVPVSLLSASSVVTVKQRVRLD